MSRYDRGHIEVHYLPARRDPADHVVLHDCLADRPHLAGRGLDDRARDAGRLSIQVTASLVANSAVSDIGVRLAEEWHGLHRGAFFTDPSIAFGRGELEGVLRQLTVTFSPTHDGAALPFERLSDGQKSLLYISLVLAWQSLARRVLNGEETRSTRIVYAHRCTPLSR